MKRQTFISFASVLVAVLLFGTTRSIHAQSCSAPFFIEQSFPTSGPAETTWRICWQMQKKHGLVITSAHFRKAPAAPFVRVFWDARVAEIFVPYHNGTTRFLDVAGFDWNWVQPLNAGDCPASLGGTLLSIPGDPFGVGPDVCKMVQDRGLAWKDDTALRRGKELVLWGAIDAANYNYLVEWTFRDDGMVIGRVGATGVNYPSHPFVNHVHNPTWRLDIDLDGFPGDSAHLGTHTETGLAATDTAPMIATETGVDWDPLKFHTLHIHDANLKNARNHQSGFHLIPLRMGTPRHTEAFTQKDFWVTRYKPAEIFAVNLPTFIAPPEPVANTDVVVWYTGSAHHLVRDEDGEIVSGLWKGEAHLMWSGFMLKPHNLFDRTPFFP